MAANFFMYAPRTVALLKRANALGKTQLALGYEPGAAECHLAFPAEADASHPRTQRFASEDALRAKLEELIVRQGGTLPGRGGNTAKPEEDRLQTITIRVNARQKAAIEREGRAWVRGLIDRSLKRMAKA